MVQRQTPASKRLPGLLGRAFDPTPLRKNLPLEFPDNYARATRAPRGVLMRAPAPRTRSSLVIRWYGSRRPAAAIGLPAASPRIRDTLACTNGKGRLRAYPQPNEKELTQQERGRKADELIQMIRELREPPMLRGLRAES
jgi:hypothetical protein